MRKIEDFKNALDFMIYLRKEENFEIGWDIELSKPIPSSFGEKWRAKVTDAEGTLKEDLLKGEWYKFEDGDFVYHEVDGEKSIYAALKIIDGKKALLAIIYK